MKTNPIRSVFTEVQRKPLWFTQKCPTHISNLSFDWLLANQKPDWKFFADHHRLLHGISSAVLASVYFNSLRPKQMDAIFADDIFKCIFLNENVWILIKISLKFVPKGPINNIPSLVKIMAWRRPGDKPLSEPMVVSLPTYICVARPQWVNCCFASTNTICILFQSDQNSLSKSLKETCSMILVLLSITVCIKGCHTQRSTLVIWANNRCVAA